MTRGYIGETIVPSEYGVSGVLSLKNHYELMDKNQLPEKLPNPPATSNVDIKFPTDECELLTTSTTVSGVNAKYFDANGLYMFTAFGTGIYRYDFTVPFELKSLNTTAAMNVSLGFEGSIGGIFFKPDGTKLFVTGHGGDDIKEYNLSTAWDVDTLTYSGRSLDLNLTSSMKETAPRSLAFSPDGTKIVITGSKGVVFQLDLGTAWDITTATTYCDELNIKVSSGGLFGHSFSANGDSIFIAENTNDNIHKYDLTTPWDITTTRINQFFIGALGELTPAGGTFNSDGTKFYFTGTTTDQVYELELSTAYDINTATFNANLQRYYLARDNNTRTIYSFIFKPDGTKLFALDSLDRITEYALTTAWDPATIRFLNSFSVAAKETEARDLFFKPDGTKMYVIGQTGDDVNEYELSTAWDTTTAVFSQNFSINAQETAPTSIAFSDDGTKMFVMGTTGDDVNEYALSEAWDVSTASYTRVFSLTVSGLVTTTPQALLFKPDGTAFYIVNAAVTSNYITKYSLGTAWDLSTAAYDSSEFFATPFAVTTDACIRFNADGTQLLFNDDRGTGDNEAIISIPLDTAYNINTAQINQAGTFGNEAAPTGIHWGDSGNYLYVIGSNSDAVDQYEALVPYKVSTCRFLRKRSVSAQETVPQSVYFNTDGTKMFIIGSTGDDVNEYSLSTAWNISTTTFVRLFSVAGQTILPSGFAFNGDGTKMFVLGQNNNTIFEYNLGTGWNLSTASYSNNSLVISFFDVTGTGLAINADGTKIYVTGQNVDCVNQIDLTSAYTLTPKNIFYVGNKETSPYSAAFKPDGTKMYIIGVTSDTVHEYDLSTAWDISTSTFLQSFSISAQETTPNEIRFKPDGTKMFVMGTTGDDINEYALSTAWDISSASFTRTFSVASQENNPFGLFFKPDGTKFYVLGSTNDAIHQYSLGTAWDMSTASYDNVSFSIVVETTSPYGLTFKSDGTRLYFLDNTLKRVVSFDLDTAWDLSSINIGRVKSNFGSPYYFDFSLDGNTAYVSSYVSTSTNYIEFHSLSTPFDITGAQYVNSRAIGSRNDNVALMSNGKLLFAHDRSDSSGLVYIYTAPNKGGQEFGTANVVSYSSADVDLSAGSLSLAEAGNPITGFVFDSTGTKLYTVDATQDEVNYFVLSVAWDITTATFNSVLPLNAYGVLSARGIRVTPDGKYLLVFSSTQFQIVKFEMTTPFVLSTSVFVKRSKRIVLQKTNAGTLAINNSYFSYDGRILYISTNNAFDSIFQFYLDENHEVINDNLRINFEDTAIRGSSTMYYVNSFCFSKDGEYLYGASPTLDSGTIFQYKLSSPFILDENISVVSRFTISSEETAVRGVTFRDDGTKMYIVGQTNNTIYEYDLTTAWSLSTASYSTNSFAVGGATLTAASIRFKPDGTKMFLLSETDNTLYQYFLPTPWDITTARRTSVESYSVYFDGAGDYLRCDAALDGITSTSQSWTVECWVYPLSAGSSLYFIGFNTASVGSNELLVGNQSYYVNGTRYSFSNPIAVNEWTHVAVTYDGSSVNIYLDGVLSATVNETVGPLADCVAGIGAEFDSGNGGSPGNYFYGYISNFRVVADDVVYSSNFTPPTGNLTEITGTSLLTCASGTIEDISTNNQTITVFGNSVATTSNPFEAGVSLDISSKLYYIENSAMGGSIDMEFNEAGTQLNIAVRAEETIDATVFFRYNLSTPWDLSTATYLDNMRYMERHDTYNISFDHYSFFQFADQGRILYLNNNVGDSMIGYRLRTPYDIKSMFNQSLGFINDELIYDASNCYSGISEDGKLLLIYSPRITSGYPFRLVAYRLTTPFDISTATKTYNTIVSLPSTTYCNFLDFSGQHLFYAASRIIYKIDLSSINP